MKTVIFKIQQPHTEVATKLKPLSYLGSLRPYQKVPEQPISINLPCRGDLLCVKEKALLSSPEPSWEQGQKAMFLAPHGLSFCWSVNQSYQSDQIRSVIIPSECSKSPDDTLKTQIRHVQTGLITWWPLQASTGMALPAFLLAGLITYAACTTALDPESVLRLCLMILNDIRWAENSTYSPRLFSVSICAIQFQVSFFLKLCKKERKRHNTEEWVISTGGTSLVGYRLEFTLRQWNEDSFGY